MNLIINLLLTIGALISFFLLKANNKNQKNKIFWLIISAVFVISIFLFARVFIYKLSDPEIWDYTCFYLYGKVAVSGYNFYQPENFHTVFSSLHLPFTSFAGLEPEVINVGFPYPPPTILYFAPLGLFSFDTAHVIWMVFNLFIVIGCIYLIYDQAFKEDKLVGIMLASILLFLLPDARYTIRCSQTNFIALFHLLLMYKYSDRKIGGIFLSLAVFTKPYMAILIFYFIYKKNWSAIIYFIITSLVLACITASLFGISPFITYITDNAYHRMPLYAFSETTNQSLNGFLIRMNIIPPGVSMEYKLIATLILIFTGIYMAYVARKKLYEYIMPVLLLVGLLVYPGTLQHYGIVVLFVLVLFLYKKSNLWSYLYWNAIIIGVFYALDRVSLFFVILFFLVLLILKSFKPSFFEKTFLSHQPFADK